MRGWVLAAGLLAAAATTGAQAADLYDGPPPDRYGSAYDDPRYADIYRYPVPPPRYAAPPPRAYRALRRAADPARARLPRGRSLRAQVPAGPAAPFLRRAAPRLCRPLPAERGRQGAAAAQRLARFPRRRRAGRHRHRARAPSERASVRPRASTAAAARSSTPGRSRPAASVPTPRVAPTPTGPPPRRWDRPY